MKKIDYDKYTIIINPSFELGVDYSIIDTFNNIVVVGNATYSNSCCDLNDFFDYIYFIICGYENRKEKEKNDNNV